MFDLPMETSVERKAYRKFVKLIKSEGFIMMQKSVYTKLEVNDHAVLKDRAFLSAHIPTAGFISILTITEKQFQDICHLIGSPSQ